MDLAFADPVDWEALDDDTINYALIDDDFCEIHFKDETVDRFIFCLMPFPVPEFDEEFRFGVWVSVSEASWDAYKDGFLVGEYDREGCFGYLANELPDFPDSQLLHVDVWFQPAGRRPRLTLHDVDHPLVAAQNNGIAATQIARWASRHDD
jgi:hypothetical protein